MLKSLKKVYSTKFMKKARLILSKRKQRGKIVLIKQSSEKSDELLCQTIIWLKEMKGINS